MKNIKCSDLKGACDVEISGETPDEMAQNSMQHVMDLLKNGDTSHNAAMEAMKGYSEEDMQAWMVEFHKKFEDAPEV